MNTNNSNLEKKDLDSRIPTRLAGPIALSGLLMGILLSNLVYLFIFLEGSAASYSNWMPFAITVLLWAIDIMNTYDRKGTQSFFTMSIVAFGTAAAGNYISSNSEYYSEQNLWHLGQLVILFLVPLVRYIMLTKTEADDPKKEDQKS